MEDLVGDLDAGQYVRPSKRKHPHALVEWYEHHGMNPDNGRENKVRVDLLKPASGTEK